MFIFGQSGSPRISGGSHADTATRHISFAPPARFFHAEDDGARSLSRCLGREGRKILKPAGGFF
jgi:hypothetical protein